MGLGARVVWWWWWCLWCGDGDWDWDWSGDWRWREARAPIGGERGFGFGFGGLDWGEEEEETMTLALLCSAAAVLSNHRPLQSRRALGLRVVPFPSPACLRVGRHHSPPRGDARAHGRRCVLRLATREGRLTGDFWGGRVLRSFDAAAATNLPPVPTNNRHKTSLINFPPPYIINEKLMNSFALLSQRVFLLLLLSCFSAFITCKDRHLRL